MVITILYSRLRVLVAQAVGDARLQVAGPLPVAHLPPARHGRWSGPCAEIVGGVERKPGHALLSNVRRHLLLGQVTVAGDCRGEAVVAPMNQQHSKGGLLHCIDY